MRERDAMHLWTRSRELLNFIIKHIWLQMKRKKNRIQCNDNHLHLQFHFKHCKASNNINYKIAYKKHKKQKLRQCGVFFIQVFLVCYTARYTY